MDSGSSSFGNEAVAWFSKTKTSDKYLQSKLLASSKEIQYISGLSPDTPVGRFWDSQAVHSRMPTFHL